MTLNLRVEITGVDWIAPFVRRINWTLETIMSTQDEIIAQLQAQSTHIQKIGDETRSLLTKVQELLDIINSGEVKPELKAAADAVDAQLQIVDDLVPDAP